MEVKKAQPRNATQQGGGGGSFGRGGGSYGQAAFQQASAGGMYKLRYSILLPTIIWEFL